MQPTRSPAALHPVVSRYAAAQQRIGFVGRALSLLWCCLAALASPPAAALAPGDHPLTVRHEGRERGFIVHVPASYRAERPVPLVLALHGGGGSMEVMARDRLYGLVSQSEASGWIVVFPNGFSRLGGKLATWNAGICCGAARDRASDDVGFLRAVVADVQQRMSVDPQRIFATGMSNGGMMSYRLACEASDVFRAIAAVAGTDGTAECRPGRPVPVLHIHARDDDRVLFGGGSGSASDTHADFVSVPATVDKWARLNSCSGPVQRVLDKPGVVCEVRSGCQGGAEVQLYVTDSGGHAWPGGRKALGGRCSGALHATEAIWAFFAQY
jgi:polyhydroxybutyrate depolymerase